MKKYLRKIKIKANILIGKITEIRPQINIKKKWFGTEYGGFYVAGEKLNEDSIIYSFGIGEDNSFDIALISKYGCKVYAFDPTPKSIKWVQDNVDEPRFVFLPYGIDDKTGTAKFLLPKNDNYVSGSVIKQNNVDENKSIEVPMKSFEDIVKELKHDKIDVLKMDIEGSEYKVIESILNTPVEIKQVIIELHERFFVDGKHKTKALLNFLELKGYKIYGVSDNMEEISLIKQ